MILRRYIRTILVAAGLFVALWLMTLTSHDTPPEPDPTPSASASRPDLSEAGDGVVVPSPLPTLAASELPEDPGSADEEGRPVDIEAPAEPRDEVQAGRHERVRVAAVGFLETFARPAEGASAGEWWAGVEPLLTEDAAAAYEGTDPRNVPFTRVTGEGVVIPSEGPAALLTVVRVETDAGFYRVELREEAAGVRVTRAIPEGDAW